jgi:hypothetical protein
MTARGRVSRDEQTYTVSTDTMLQTMPAHYSRDGQGERHSQPTGFDRVESYEVEGGVVFFDTENPLAWVEATRTVSLSEVA